MSCAAVGRGGDVVYSPGGRLQGAGALRCQTFPQRALDRQLEISRLLPATNAEILSFFFPRLLFIVLWRKKKGNFSGFQNKQGQSIERE